MLKPKDYRVTKRIINENFTFSDLSRRFVNVDSSTGNIFCPFHENHETPAAKMYWDDYRGIWILHCFGECHRNFTAYDYVDLIMCKRWQKYKSPLEFLQQRMSIDVLNMQIDTYNKITLEDDYYAIQDKVDYINSTFMDYDGNIVDYIESLYTA